MPSANVNVVASSAPVVQVTSGVDGGASVLWTLGPTAGEQTVTASVQGVDPVEFSATAEPGPPVAVVVAGGDGQIGPPDGTLSAPLVASVVDQYRNPLSGQTVDWSVSAGGGRLSSSSGRTDGSGTTSTTLTLGSTLGFNTVTASSTALGPSDFHALALTTVWDDAVGDTFSDGLSADRVLPDLAHVGVAWDADTLIVGLSFADSVVSTQLGGRNAMGGVVDFDVDMDSLTGIESLADRFRPGSGSTGMGVDVVLDMFADPSGEFLIFNDRQQTLGSTAAEFRGRLVAMRVPSAIIGSGPLAIAVTAGTAAEPTDIAPNDSSFVVSAGGGSPSLVPYPAPAGRPSKARSWGPMFRNAHSTKRRAENQHDI